MGRTPKYKTVEELQIKIDNYFNQICGVFPLKDESGKIVFDKKGKPVLDVKPPTVCGLAYNLGFASRQSIYDMEKTDKFSYTIKRALLQCEQFAEEQLYGSRPVGAIFALKNRGWKDKSEVDFNSKNVNLNIDYSALTEEEAKELYKKIQQDIKNDK
jgi:hypothetical protein